MSRPVKIFAKFTTFAGFPSTIELMVGAKVQSGVIACIAGVCGV